MVNKADLREKMITQLKQLDPEVKNAVELRFFAHLISSSLWKNATVIGTTISQKMEWDTKRLIRQAWKEGKTIVIPKCNNKKKLLTFYKITSEKDLTIGYANIKEPRVDVTEKVDKESIDLLLVPGIVFDAYGFRIGFGGGYYDRFLRTFQQPTISLVSKMQLMDQIPTEEYDIPVQFIITEDGCKEVDNRTS
ncbi:5-formyltetrahydrofolate cyclo-ligase [Pseudogracilibacillus auburnensis]|uniref:5-formyltetrahydrofolate cyclo-ligase n=1 Tax=Pseudogracilibacillus auburnensis TaxID=1494959 RepID=UPI001F611385|nr:5-formyltetrahydrofolate cyclo-ligase [Pseudogracilibacillus auburnensis]